MEDDGGGSGDGDEDDDNDGFKPAHAFTTHMRDDEPVSE
jgi:hypothetical protein